MAYSDLIATFQSTLNRDDVSDAQADVFLQQGINRLQRAVRLPCMEREYDIQIVGTTNTFIIPTDLLAIIDVIYTSSTTGVTVLDKLDYRDVIVRDATLSPFAYSRIRGNIQIVGSAGDGDQIRVLYYGAFGPLASNAADNEVTLGFPDIAVYAGLVFAAAAYSHPSKDDWEKTYQSLKQDLIDEAIAIEASGGTEVIEPMYSEPY